MFATDRDLLVLEPRVFFDVSWTAQTLVNAASGGTINSAGDTLTLSGGNFVNLGITAGFVAVVGSMPLEVVGRVDATTLSVSRLRSGVTEPVIPAVAGSALKVVIHTFRPQIGIVHGQVMRMLGIEPGAAGEAGRPGETDIKNPSALRLVESLGALHLIYSSAAALVGHDSPMWVKAQMYRERFQAERGRLVVEIDLDGDGEADTVRRANVFQFVRV
ncbi:MAG: hypothetical protein JNK58_06145 [Phycisphaerae bacterium]|nr:hypothetical protein [Phycisphaerae bacterium]